VFWHTLAMGPQSPYTSMPATGIRLNFSLTYYPLNMSY
jgi:hypothetical protein